MDEMFDATDTITPTAETSFTVSDLEPETSVFLRVAAAAGTLEAPLLSAWTTHVTGMSAMPPPPPPAPMAPATPTGLMAETGEGSITWSWDAVEGADGYAVQVSMDEMFDDMDETTYTMETSHTVEDLGYSETRFARVASTSGEGEDMLKSMYTTHVTGMSMAEPPPPPPPAPDPVMAEFMVPDDAKSGFAMVPDDDVRPASAMAMLNTEMVVKSNSTAVITPMFIEDSAGVQVDAADDNTPFAYVDWGRLQSEVIASGATFMIQRTTMGANQEMEPTGDVAYVTCGPFRCAEGMDAPEFSIDDSAACSAFDPDLELQIGLIDNDFLDGTPTPAVDGTNPALSTGGTANRDDGIDLGWRSSSSVTMTVKHVLAGVGDTYKVTGPEAGKGSNKVLTMNKRTVNNQTSTGAEIYNENHAYTPGIMIEGIPDPLGTTGNQGYTADGDTTLLSACVPPSLTDANAFTYASTIGSNQRPDECFRVAAAHLEGYSVEVEAKDSEVSWGKVDWADDPFADLECEPVTFDVTDQVDVCAMFEDEVDHALGDGWGKGSGRSVDVVLQTDSGTGSLATGDIGEDSSTDTPRNVASWSVGPRKTADPNQFKTLWFDDDLDGAIRTRPSDEMPGARGPNDLYDTAATLADGSTANPNLRVVWRNILSNTGAFRYGDFGKVDLAGKDRSGSVRGNDKAAPDGHPDNYDRFRYPCSDSDGEGCDAEWSADYTVLFADGVFGCTAERTITISCEWDADGEMAGYRRTDHDALLGAAITTDTDGDGNAIDDGDEATTTGVGLTNADTAGARTAGAINAFAKCKVN